MCGVYIFINGHEVYSRVGDMSGTLNHLFDVINMQHKFVMFRSREIFFGKRGARDTFSHHEVTVDVGTSFQ